MSSVCVTPRMSHFVLFDNITPHKKQFYVSDRFPLGVLFSPSPSDPPPWLVGELFWTEPWSVSVWTVNYDEDVCRLKLWELETEAEKETKETKEQTAVVQRSPSTPSLAYCCHSNRKPNWSWARDGERGRDGGEEGGKRQRGGGGN